MNETLQTIKQFVEKVWNTEVFGAGTLLALAGTLVTAYATRSTVTPRD